MKIWSVIKQLYFICAIPALWLHEMGHYLMALLLGHETVHFKINAGVFNNDNVSLHGQVRHGGGNIISQTMVTLAPTILWIFLFLLSALSVFPIWMAYYFCLYWDMINCGRGDLKSVKGLWIKENNIITNNNQNPTHDTHNP